jgi:hypothetical protein
VAFYINTKTGAFVNLNLAKKALNVLPNYDFSKIAYSFKDYDGKIKLFIRDLKTNKDLDLEISTFVEKCVWEDNNILYCAVPININHDEEPDN